LPSTRVDADYERPVRRIARPARPAFGEPAVRQLNGEDPTAFVLSANIHRRHMTKGQRAMAMIYPEPEKGGRGQNRVSSKGRKSGGAGPLWIPARGIVTVRP
jgi:hypothetical protein